MNTAQHNRAEEEELLRIRDGLKWHLGVELGIDPRSSKEALFQLEMRFAHWLLNEGGGAWLAELIKTKEEA